MVLLAIPLTLLLSVCAVHGAWNPANGVKELDVVEAALHRIVDNPKLSAAQLKMAKRVVGDVDNIVAQLEAGKNITKEVKAQKVGQAIQKLQDLQGQFELSAVQQALGKVISHSHMTTEMAKSAKEVADTVNKVAEELEAGKHLSQAEKAKKVQGAIKQLQNLQGLFERASAVAGNATVSQQLQTLESKLTLKKKELARAEDMLKLDKLKKELLEKKEQLSELEHKKDESTARKEVEARDAKQQEEMVAKLVGMAKQMKAAKQGAKKDSAKVQLPAPIQAILVDLQARANNVSASLAKLDAEEKARETKADQTAKAAANSKDPTKAKKLQSMLKFLGKEEKHTYSKLRAAKARNLEELQEAIDSVKTGDLEAVQKVMQKMQHDVKSLEVKTHNFLY